uniref:Uncharacterized protein n=1 Tax=Parascaris univalens TaxID=6257 RepID=A0A914ZX10_PARUN
MDVLVAGLDGVAAYLDDIVTGGTIGEHNRRLEAIFQRIHKYVVVIDVVYTEDYRGPKSTWISSIVVCKVGHGPTPRVVDTFFGHVTSDNCNCAKRRLLLEIAGRIRPATIHL